MSAYMEGPMPKGREKNQSFSKEKINRERGEMSIKDITVAMPPQEYLGQCFSNCYRMLKQEHAVGAGPEGQQEEPATAQHFLHCRPLASSCPSSGREESLFI